MNLYLVLLVYLGNVGLFETEAEEYCSGIPLTGISISPICFRGSNYPTDCRQPIRSNTIIKYTCKTGYKKSSGDTTGTIFCAEGLYNDYPFKCEPECGIHNDNNTSIKWNTDIFIKLDENKIARCDGTVISDRLILSAAHCFWDKIRKKTVDPSLVEVQSANYYLGARDVSEIYIPEGFQNDPSDVENDLAILVLRDFIPFGISKDEVLPVCVESNDNEAMEGIQDRELTTPLLKGSQCKTNSNNNEKLFQISCTNEKENCTSNSGGGFAIPKIINGETKYFLEGIMTTTSSDGINCSGSYSVTVLNIKQHSAIISEYLNKFSVEYDLTKSESFPCDVPYIPNLIMTHETYRGKKWNLNGGDLVNGLNKISYSCENNQKLIGTKSNYCYYDTFYKSGKWAENHPVCIEATKENSVDLPLFACRMPNISNLIILDWSSNEIPTNYVKTDTRIRYRCDKNFHLSGKAENYCGLFRYTYEHPTCLSTYTESASQEKCAVPFFFNGVIVLQGPLQKNVSVGSYIENENGISYICREGHLLYGGSSNYCYEGKWLSEHPSCVKFTLTKISKDDCEVPKIENGIAVLESIIKENLDSQNYVKYYQYISYKCKRNHRLDGVSGNVCYYNGEWRDKHPNCIKITKDDCAVPAISNLEIVLEGEVNKIVTFGDYVQNFNIVKYRCKGNNLLQGANTNNCIRGKWTSDHPTCIKYCSNETLQAVTFSTICTYNGARIPCDQYLRVGTKVRIICEYGYKQPDRLVPDEIICDDSGRWDYEPFRCEPICGTEQSDTLPFIKGGDTVNITSVPWHAAIYSSLKGKQVQICGGSVISSRIVISAAHCFWLNQGVIIDKSYVSVAVGKYYRDFYADEPLEAQYFNVTEIHIPEGFQGPLQAYRDDIAIIVLDEYIKFKPYIKPICIQRLDLEEKTIQSGLIGRVAGWGKTASEKSSEELRMLEIPTLSYSDCINSVDFTIRNSIAPDKFCVASPEGESVCRGDSGGGFAIHKIVNNIKTFFLWGIVSNGLTNKDTCDDVNLTSLTNVQHYYDTILFYQRKYEIK